MSTLYVQDILETSLLTTNVPAVERSIQTFARLYHKQGEMCKRVDGPYTLVKKPVL